MKFILYVLVIGCCVFGCPSESFREGESRVGRIVINEVLYNLPEGRDLEEWIELYNNSKRQINLKGWTIDDRDTHRFTFHEDLVLMPGQYLVFATNREHVNISFEYQSQVIRVIAYQTTRGNPLNLQIWNNDGDEILLKDNQGTIVDYIAYGNPLGSGRDPQPAGAEWQGNIPTPPPGHAIALFPNGYDRNTSAHWGFRTPEQITPGQENR